MPPRAGCVSCPYVIESVSLWVAFADFRTCLSDQQVQSRVPFVVRSCVVVRERTAIRVVGVFTPRQIRFFRQHSRRPWHCWTTTLPHPACRIRVSLWYSGRSRTKPGRPLCIVAGRSRTKPVRPLCIVAGRSGVPCEPCRHRGCRAPAGRCRRLVVHRGAPGFPCRARDTRRRACGAADP